MFKPLLRTLPSLSGNVQISCDITDIEKLDDNTYIGFSRNANLKPLQNSMYNEYVNIDLLNGLYEFDIKSFYKRYLDIFYKSNFNIPKTDFLKVDLIHNTNNDRNKDYEFGCSRVSYFHHGYQFMFFAPIYIDSENDIPDYFEITVKINEYISKKLRIQIGIQDTKNYLYYYITHYCSKIDNKVIYYNENLNEFIYHAIDVNNGGFAKIQDNTIRYITNEQIPINEFDKKINKGYENNKLVIKQILPLSFSFNVDDLFTPSEKLVYKYLKISQISGKYVKNGASYDLYDFNTNYDELQLTGFNDLPYNVMYNDTSIMSLKEKYLDIYKYDNKLSPYYNRWKLYLSSDDDIYYTNLNINFSDSKLQKYGNFPNYYNSLKLYDIIDNNLIIEDNNQSLNYKNIIDYEGNYWYTLLSQNKLNENIFTSYKWNECINNFSYVNNILYNLNGYVDKDIKLDYFNIFLIPNFYINTNYVKDSIIKVKNSFTFTSSKKNIYVNDVETLINDKDNEINFNLINSKVEDQVNNCLLENDALFIKSNLKNKNMVKYVLYDLPNKYVLLSDFLNVRKYVHVKNNSRVNSNKDNYVKNNYDIKYKRIRNLIYDEYNKLKISTIEGFIEIDNINNINNIKYIASKKVAKTIYVKIPFDNTLYRLSDIDIDSLDNYQSNLKFYKLEIFIDYYYLHQFIDENTQDLSNAVSDKIFVTTINKLMNRIPKYKYDFKEENEYYIFYKDEKKYYDIYIDTYNTYSDIITEMKNFKRYYANIQDQRQIDNFYNLEFSKFFDQWQIRFPFIKYDILTNDKFEVFFKKYKIETLNINDYISKMNNKVVSVDVKGNTYDGLLFKEILGKKISKYEISKILNNNYTYYLYIQDKETIDYNEEFLHTISSKFKPVTRKENKKTLIPIYKDCLRNIKEINHQKEMINSGYICGMNSDGSFFNINKSNVKKLRRSQIKYVKDLNDKYENIIECQVNDDINVIVDLVINKIIYDNPKLVENKYWFFHWILNWLFNDKTEYINFKYIKNIIKRRKILGDEYVYYININAFNNHINNILSTFNKYNNIFNQKLYYQNIFKTVFNFRSANYIDINKVYDDIEELKNNLFDLQLEFYNKIFDALIFEELKITIQSNDLKPVLGIDTNKTTYLYQLLKYIYDNHYDKFINIINYFNITFYELFDNNNVNVVNYIDQKLLSLVDYIEYNPISPNIIIMNYNGKKYGALFINKYFDNTTITYNLEDTNYFNKINGIPVNKSVMMMMFYKIMPYLRYNLFNLFINALFDLKMYNLVMFPSRYVLNINYEAIKSLKEKEEDNYDSYNFKDEYNGIYTLNQLQNTKKIYLYRYLNYICPVLNKVNKVHTYSLKYKNNDFDFGKDNIFLNDQDPNKYQGFYLFYDNIYNKLKDNKHDIIKEYEYKHFNDNSYYFLENEFTIEINKYLTYDEVLEYETFNGKLEQFKNYLKKYIKINNIEENEILFLFNKYKIDCISNPILLDLLKTNKLYKLKYIFKLL